MSFLLIVTIIFLVLELSNVGTLYFFPESKYSNGVGVFNAWEKSKKDPEIHRLVQYLMYWVAGTKLIFIALLIVILLTGDIVTQWFASLAMVLSIASFYWKLFPLIRSMDADDQITPKNYSKTLGLMIGVFIVMFVLALIFGWPF